MSRPIRNGRGRGNHSYSNGNTHSGPAYAMKRSPTYVSRARVELAHELLTSACTAVRSGSLPKFVSEYAECLVKYNREANRAFHTPYLFDSLVRISATYFDSMSVEDLAAVLAEPNHLATLGMAMYWSCGVATDREQEAEPDEPEPCTIMDTEHHEHVLETAGDC